MDEEVLEAALSGEKELENYLGYHIIDCFFEPIHKERVFPIRLEKVKQNPEFSKWYGLIYEIKTSTIVGMIGFKNPPNEKELIEIGYAIHPTFQRKGYASEMAEALKE
ncbi:MULTISPECIES: GNAT family N-acetyltransferase [Bacillus]|uniref:GNAT family N-acetyltransferase n=1 Tax=Bacillus TaxID=1386 RepID=UPI0002E4438C|nr:MULTISPECIES: GNAT family N-acetyltransferase [Bacillus]